MFEIRIFTKKVSEKLRNVLKKMWCVLKIVSKCFGNRMGNFLRNVGNETGILAFKLMVNRNLHAMER